MEAYKSLLKANPDFMWDYYAKKPVTYDLSTGETLYLPKTNTICF